MPEWLTEAAKEISVEVAKVLQRAGVRVCEICPQGVEDLRIQGQVPRGVIYLSCLDSNTSAATMSSMPSRMTQYHRNASGCLVQILQILPDDANIIVVTEGAVSCQSSPVNSHQALGGRPEATISRFAKGCA